MFLETLIKETCYLFVIFATFIADLYGKLWTENEETFNSNFQIFRNRTSEAAGHDPPYCDQLCGQMLISWLNLCLGRTKGVYLHISSYIILIKKCMLKNILKFKSQTGK